MKYLFAWMMALVASVAMADVTVTGLGESRAEPDQAEVSFTVSDTTDSVKASIDRVSVDMKKIISKLRFNKIADRHITTTSITVQPSYHYPTTGEPKFVGYIATTRVTVCVEDVTKAGDIASGVLINDSVRLDGVSFTASEQLKSRLLDEARQAAMKNAMKKANMYSELAGVRLGKMSDFRESHEDRYARPNRMYMTESSMPGGNRTQLPGGEINMTVTVQTVFPILATK